VNRRTGLGNLSEYQDLSQPGILMRDRYEITAMTFALQNDNAAQGHAKPE